MIGLIFRMISQSKLVFLNTSISFGEHGRGMDQRFSRNSLQTWKHWSPMHLYALVMN